MAAANTWNLTELIGSLWQYIIGTDPKPDIGAKHNDWVSPITEFGDCDAAWLRSIQHSRYVGHFDIPETEWTRFKDAVNKVMAKLLKEMQKQTRQYEGLKIDSYVRQGSSRDGLKVVAANEFDAVIEFHIEGLTLEKEDLKNDGDVIPGFCLFKVSHPRDVHKNFPKLSKLKVFKQVGNEIYLNAKELHERVFMSLVDTASKVFENTNSLKGDTIDFYITRKKNPPAINITINMNEEAHDVILVMPESRNFKNPMATKAIDLDIVPAVVLRTDKSTNYEGLRLNCPVHAVCKWVEGDTVKMLPFVDHRGLVWHINSAGYEKHALDVARTGNDLKQHYILTALRIMKTFFEKTKTIAKVNKEAPPQLVTVLRSYHLKHIAFYLLMYTCHLYKGIKIDGARQAVTYFVCLLEAALEVEHLPHFFYSNSKITRMFPGFPAQERLKYDHFAKAAPGSMMQALRSLQRLLKTELKVDTRNIAPKMIEVIKEFKEEISSGEYV